MKKRLSTRLLSLLLVAALLIGMVPTASAVSPKSDVTVTQVDNSAVSVNPLQREDGELNIMNDFIPSEVVRVSIVLKKASTIEAGFSTMGIAGNEAAMAYRADLKKDQVSMVQKIEKAIKADLDVVWNLTLAANLISANVRYDQIKTIEALPGVECVVLENQYLAAPVEEREVELNMATSGAQTGSHLAWAEGYTGAGTRIAVVDTGTDTDHQSLNATAYEYALAQNAQEKGMSYEDYVATLDLLDAEEIAAVAQDLNMVEYLDVEDAYFNTKLPFGFNYKDADYDITHDNDEEGEHGSHVAGIATANSWLYNAETGNYGKATEYCFMQGVAPEAQLLTMKVFGKAGSPYDSDYFAAIEDAIVLGADVINLSLGSVAPGRGTHNNKVFQGIMDELRNTDTVVAISAGNSGPWAEMAENNVNLGGMGYLYNTDVSLDTVGQPGSFTNSLAVASVVNDGMIGYYIDVAGQMIVYNEDNRDGEFTNQSFTTIAGEHEYIFLDAVGKAEDWEAVADVVKGKIALCSRGETNFVEKATLAVEAGAIAVFIYNNQSGVITLDLTDYTYSAPVAALTQAQGAAIRAASTPVLDESGNVKYLTGTMTVSNTIGMGMFDSAYYTMSDFSSWGVPGSLEMKPEITAPGGNIYSIRGSTPENGQGTGGYVIMSGTSMASPQVAGMSALMAQFVKENGLAEKTGMSPRHLIQSLLMSTAQPLLASEGVYYPVLQQGAGMANVSDAMNADSYLTMAPGTNSGAEDGKIKVELFDDPGREGDYSAIFTVHNLEDTEKVLELTADFFVQALASDGEHTYLDYTTTSLPMNVAWVVGGVMTASETMDGCDFNGDGRVDLADGQAILDYATGVIDSLSSMDKADIDGDGDVDSYDAYLFYKGLSTTSATVPAGGTVDIKVSFSIPADVKAELDENYPNGTYIQGYLFASTGETDHSIPVLGFYGNWTDPSMFDVGQWSTYATGEDTRIPYIGRTRGNDFHVMYEWDPGYKYSFAGNPIIPDAKYMPERNAMNSADTIDSVSFIAIRHADQSRVQITNETTGKTIMDQATGPVNMAYYYGALGWQNSGLSLTTNFSLGNEAEGDEISMAFTLIPEYYIDEEGVVDFEALGKGATLSTSFVIDNTAPELFGVSIDLMSNSMTVKASDNNYIAGVGLYNKTGTRVLAQTGAKQDIEKGETAEYSFSLDKVNGKKFLLQVFDYAMNRSTYLIEMQIGESVDLPEMMAYDLVSHHWTGFDKTFEYNYKVGTPRIAYADHVYYAATIAEHYVFASTNKGELYVMPEDDLSDITYITDLEMVLYDMAYNKADGEIYAVTEQGELVSFHKLTGEVTRIGKIGVNTNTLACSPEGVFYCNELATGKVYSFTLETMDEPELLMEDPYLTHVDPIMGADMGGTTGNMGMEYNPNTDMICWNSHCEVLIGSYITYAHYYEINPENGEFTRYADFWHEMSGLIIPDRTGKDDGWASPTDKVAAVKLNKSEIHVIRNTSAQLIANVQPWTATDRDVTWTSADESIATVNKHGLVTGVKEGTTTIRATSNLDPSFYAECTVNVEILDVTIHGTLTDEDGNTMFYDWDMSQEDGWVAGAALDRTMTSATYSTAENVFYMMDNESNKWMMHKVSPDGTVLQSAPNTNSVAFWDMAYNPYFSEVHGEEQLSSIYYYYLLSPKNPMNMNAVGFNLGDLADYLVGITSLGYERQADEEGVEYDTEHLVLMDNDGYVWDFWVYDEADGGMNALFNIAKSNITCEFPGDDTMDNLYTSLMAGEDGNLYLSTFNGTTNEIWHLSYDADIRQYVAVKLGDFGNDVWPASITSVTVNGSAAANTASPAPMYTMAAQEISENELKAASVRARFTVSEAELEHKLAVNAAGTEADPTPFVIGDNTVTAPKTGYFFTYTAEKDGTATISIEGVDWRATTYINGELSGNTIHNPKYDGSVITRDLTAGDVLLFKITPYSGYSSTEREITVNFAFSGEGGTVVPEPTDPTDPVPTDPEPTDPTDPEPSEPAVGEDTMVLGTNDLVSGTKYTYTANADGRLEFDFVITDAEGKQIYQYAYGKGERVKILINGNYVVNLADTKVSVRVGDVVNVELQSVDGGAYNAKLTMSALAAATKLVIGDNNIATKTDYSFIADRDGTLYTTIKELWCDNTYCSDASLSSSVVFKINGVAVYGFENSYEVKAGDEITVLMGTSFGETANAVLNLSWDGFYKHPAGSRGNPYVLDYAEFPTTVEIPAGEAVWYKLTGFYSGYYLDIYGENAYVVISGKQYNVSANGLRIPGVSSLQIGNSGTADATFTLEAGIEEGTSDNPKDLVNGKQSVELEPSENFYYDFVANQAGQATFTVTGDNWRFFYSLIGADGTVLVADEDHRMVREGDSNSVTVDLATGQSILIKLATMNSSWSSTGGELTVDFHFTPAEGACAHDRTEVRNAAEATCSAEGFTGDTYCLDCGVRIKQGQTIPMIDHTPGAEATCHAPQICTVCSAELVAALGHTYENGVCIRCGAAEPVVDPEHALVLGTNELVSGQKYNYAATEEGRLEFDFIIKDAEGKQIYQYAYGKGERVKILINGNYVVNLADTKVSVRVGDVVNVELQSIDGGEYTATLTLTGLAPASKLVLGDNDIAKDTDYSYIATKDGTLYLTIKELICDNAYCSEVSLSSSVIFRINGVTVYGFENSYEVKAGDEITVNMGTQFGESASAVLNMSWDGFYKHPLGSRGNPIVINYADMPTNTPKIPAGTAYWFKFSGFPASAEIKLQGAEGAYVIYAGETYQVPEGRVMNIGSVRTIQIGNSGTGEASFYLYYVLKEGTVDNPKDLVEGKNTVTIDKSANYYYDFVATQNGTATFTVSGDNWRFFYSLFGADGTALVSEEDHQAKRGDAATVTVDMTAGQSILVKLGTLNSSWVAPGGELTVDFHFEASGTVDPEPTDPEPTEPSEPEVPENLLVLGKNNLTSGTTYGYVVPADGRMEFSVGSVYNSAGSKQYSWWGGTKLSILIDGKAMASSSYKRNVKAGQVITVMIESLDGDTYTADMTLKEIAAAETLKLGQNSIAQNLEHVYTAERNGTVYISVVEMLYNGKNVTESALGNSVQMTVNGASVSTFNKSCEVKAGDEIAIVVKDYSWDGSGIVDTTINLSYEGFFEHPAGSLMNPVELMYADCPTKSIQIAAGAAAWYELEGDPGDYSTPSNYPFKGKTLVVTGANAYVIVDNNRHDAVNGVVKVEMNEQTMIQIGNAGNAAAIFDISIEIPEGHVDNPKDLNEGENKISLPSYGTYHYDFHATANGTATVTVSGENWKYTFAHYAANGEKLSTKDYYAKNGDSDTVELPMQTGEYIVVTVGTSQGYSQPGGDITVKFHFEADSVCEHTNKTTTTENKVDPTCTADGSYETVVTCDDCGEELSREKTVVPALGHDYQDGICGNCGEADPNAPDNTVIVEVVHDVDATNGVTTVTWDPAKMTLVDFDIHADYTSVLESEGALTFGYVSLRGIPAGKAVATLTFEAVDPADALVTIEHKQINNDNAECTEHTWSDWSENNLAQLERECLHCGHVQVNPFADLDLDAYYVDAVLWAVENKITTGTSSVTFSPKNNCLRSQVVTFLWRAAGCPKAENRVNHFVDVKESASYYEAVLWAVENNITKGVDATHFAPGAECTRGEIVTFLWRAMGSPVVEGEHPFTDVKVGSFYEKAVIWASANNIVNGMTATTFGPGVICTRGQIVTFLYRAYA